MTQTCLHVSSVFSCEPLSTLNNSVHSSHVHIMPLSHVHIMPLLHACVYIRPLSIVLPVVIELRYESSGCACY